jgi:hypothetical protein
MKSISINGYKLHEIRMPVVPFENNNSIVSRCYPKGRIVFNLHNEFISLVLPSDLVLEIYRTGILPQDENQKIPVKISGKPIGDFKIVDFLYPNNVKDQGLVFVTLEKW